DFGAEVTKSSPPASDFRPVHRRYAGVQFGAETIHQWRQRKLSVLSTSLADLLVSGFRRGVNSVAKGLPKKPNTGRNEVLDTPEKRKKACDLVSKYERMGDSKRVTVASSDQLLVLAACKTWSKRRRLHDSGRLTAQFPPTPRAGNWVPT